MTSTRLEQVTGAPSIESLRPEHSHGFSEAEVHGIMDQIYARGDRLMTWFLASHFALALVLALYHQTWVATILVGGGALASFVVAARLLPRTFFTRAFAGIAQQAFVALHIYQLYGQSEQHFWYFTAFTMMIVYQDALCMWPGALLIIFQHILFAGLHNAGMPVHFFPEEYVGFTKLFYHFGIALVHVGICGYWALLLRRQSLGDAWRKRQLKEEHQLLEVQVSRLRESEAALTRTTAALADASRRQRAILDNSDDAMWIKDLEGRYVAANAAFARYAGHTLESIVGKSAADFTSGRRLEDALAFEREVVATGKPLTYELEWSAHGVTRTLEVTVRPVLDEGGRVQATSGHSRDITDSKAVEAERRHAESRLQHTQKLESLGLLAGGIAHDFNNLLVGILGNAEMAQSELPEHAEARQSIEQIEQAALRAADLTKQMLAYAGKGRVEVLACDVSAIVREMSELLHAGISKKAEFRFELDGALPTVEADATQLRQVIMNLITNAADAIGDARGTITLRTAKVELAAGDVVPRFGLDELHPGTYVRIEVVDTGVGMTTDMIGRIFEPFFSTKFVGRGLGLAAVLGILRSHHGAIDVTSCAGGGSAFRIHLPAMAGRRGEAASSPAPKANGKGARAVAQGLIVVVDDETSVRTLAARIVGRRGYEVMTAADGQEAVELVRAHGDRISLVLLDMLMPRLNGEEAFAEIRRARPSLPVIFSSGFTEGSMSERLLGEPNVAFIGKPYGANQLMSAITGLLERDGGPSEKGA